MQHGSAHPQATGCQADLATQQDAVRLVAALHNALHDLQKTSQPQHSWESKVRQLVTSRRILQLTLQRLKGKHGLQGIEWG